MIGVEAYIAALKARGVKYLFCLPGSTEARLLEALREDKELNFVLSLVEGATVGMADGYARASGQPGIASLHTSVGSLGGLSMLYNSWRDQVPVVITSFHKSTRILGRKGFTSTINTPEQMRPLVKWSYQSLNADQIGEDTERAIHYAMSGPQGPTYLAIPEDLAAGKIPDSAAVSVTPGTRPVRPDAQTIAEVAHRLHTAKLPVLMTGTGVARGAATELAIALAEELALPVFWENRRSLLQIPFPAEHPQFVGGYIHNDPLLAEADLLFAVGADLFMEFYPAREPEIPTHLTLIHAHRDALEVGKLYAPSIGIQADGAPLLSDLLAAVRALGPIDAAQRQQRMAAIQRAHAAKRAARDADGWAHERDTVPIAVRRIGEEMHRVMPRNTIVLDEAIRSTPALVQGYPLQVGHFHRTAGLSLGWGVPAAVGVQIARPDQPVVVAVGDGSFHFTPQALWTAAQQRLPIVVLVMRNNKYLAVKAGVEAVKGVYKDDLEQPGIDIGGIDHCAMAQCYGALSARVEHPDQLGDVLSEAITVGREKGRPFVVDIAVREERFRQG